MLHADGGTLGGGKQARAGGHIGKPTLRLPQLYIGPKAYRQWRAVAPRNWRRQSLAAANGQSSLSRLAALPCESQVSRSSVLIAPYDNK